LEEIRTTIAPNRPLPCCISKCMLIRRSPELTITGPLSILARRIKDTDLGKKTIQQGTNKDLPIKLTEQNKRTNRKSKLATYENINSRNPLLQNL
jgi:hypothetical protein